MRRYLEKDIAIQRMEKLLEMALEIVAKDPELARKHVDLALRIGRRTRVKVPRKYKAAYCKHCLMPLVPGLTARFRLRSRREPHIVITCLSCKRIIRVPYGG